MRKQRHDGILVKQLQFELSKSETLDPKPTSLLVTNNTLDLFRLKLL